ncbi:MAG: PqqD family protein [Ruminococcaceae bacterium]|nr:PqqD family protein [Oscillospiraceae bacterium]
MSKRKKQERLSANYLEKIPRHSTRLSWSSDEKGAVTLSIENKGLANRLAQLILRKPKISYIHLDELGSFVWPLIDGERTILSIGEAVEAHFGDKAKPTYERLAKFFQILDSYGFVEWNDPTST